MKIENDNITMTKAELKEFVNKTSLGVLEHDRDVWNCFMHATFDIDNLIDGMCDNLFKRLSKENLNKSREK